ncbi:MAG: hypothetical protein NT145_06615 [Elusimicrobia bacterium]|nr:hypothetical protein [Elusimicrobiota bacterium]
MKSFFRIILLVSIALGPLALYAEYFHSQGQIAGWLEHNDLAQNKLNIGFRYLPEFSVSREIEKDKTLDADIAINAYAQAPADFLYKAKDNSDLKFYRFWGRFHSNQFETRLGLQQISFGPAKILRSLMWFDSIDPRDPLKFTEGNWAALARYYFLNNSNIWLWGLYGNDKLKGLETVKTDPNKIEYGGRCQFPLPKGEGGISFDRRCVNQNDWNRIMAVPLADCVENRLGFDGYWDIGVGLWFETSIGKMDLASDQQEYEENYTIGADYTFSSGLHILGEHMFTGKGADFNCLGKKNNVSVFVADYKLGILDAVSAIEYYNWDIGKVYSNLRWLRTYDNWQFNLIVYSNGDDTTTSYSGRGMQFLVMYNY